MWLGRRSSWAIGHSATIAGGPIGTLPCGPTTWVNIDVGMTSTSRSHGVVLGGERVDLGGHRIEEARRQAPPDAGHDPHLSAECRGRRRDRRRPDGDHGALRVDGECLDQHHVGMAHCGPGHAGVDRFHFDVVALESTHERRRGVPGIECEHANVTSPDQAIAGHVRIADRDHDRLVGKHRGEFGAGAVAADLIGELPHRLERLGRGGHVRAQPPQRPGEWMSLDDAPTRDDQPRRIEVQRSERVGGLLDQRRGIGPLRPRHVAEMLDRVHGATVPRLR